MRYRVDATPQDSPDASVFAASAVYTLAVGCGFVAVGWRARQWWLVSTGALLAAGSGAYLLWHLLAA